MNEVQQPKSKWRLVRRLLIGVAMLATLVAIFYTEENWRGKRAWEECKRAAEAKGFIFDWSRYIPEPIADDLNFFKAPKMAEWFVKASWGAPATNELTELLKNSETTATITNETGATKYLAWSEQFEPAFEKIREGLKRPYASIPGDYSEPFAQPIPHFVAVRAVAQTLAQRARCDFILGRSDDALRDLKLMREMCRMLEHAPTSKPITLVEAMINVAVSGLYTSAISEGFKSHVWNESQMIALQKDLERINLLPIVAGAFKGEAVASTHVLQTTPPDKISDMMSGSTASGTLKRLGNPVYLFLTLAPRGWVYQNSVNMAALGTMILSGFDLEHGTIAPRVFDEAVRDGGRYFSGRSPFKMILSRFTPNFARATRSMAHTQTQINELQIVCALERYRLAHHEYPESLAVLSPGFIGILPRDVIGGTPLKYQRSSQGFILYSIAWNEKDEGGKTGSNTNGIPSDADDWIWGY